MRDVRAPCAAAFAAVMVMGGCGGDAVGPDGGASDQLGAASGQARIDTIKVGLARGSFHYDERGNAVRFDFGTLTPDASNPQFQQTLYSLYQYAQDVRVGGETFVLKEDEFVKARTWSYGYDSRGRLETVTTSVLLNPGYTPTHTVSTATYRYDADDRVVEILGGGWRTVIRYGADGNVAASELHTTDGPVLVYTFTHDAGVNPFYRAQLDGVVLPIGSWAMVLSPNNPVRTETSVLGQEGVVSVHTTEIAAQDELGYPTRMIHRLWNTREPGNGEEFAVEMVYAHGVFQR